MSIVKNLFLWVLKIFQNAINVVFTLMALVILLAVLSGVMAALTQKGLPAGTVLTLDARGGFSDQPAIAGFPGFGGAPPSVVETVLALDRAENDDRVAGLYMRIGGGGIPYAAAQELRQSIAAFRAAGKFVIVHAQSFSSNGLTDYYLASAADEIWLQPGTEVNMAGVASATLFMRGLFDKIEAKPQIEQRYEFKNAANVYTESDYTNAHREATTRLMQSLYDTATAETAASRGMSTDQFIALLNGAPHLSAEALANKLVDHLGFDDDAEKAATDRAGTEEEPVALATYYMDEGGSRYTVPFGADATIALVLGEGAIVDGSGASDPFGGESMMGGDSIAQAIRDATEDEDVKAILFRVSSPGGSAIASDQILDAIRKAQAAGKPVVVSMGTVAASGGYYVSLSADKIYAQPTTITGSIGVLSGKLAIGDSYALVGLNYRTLSVGGPLATMNLDGQPYTEEQLAALRKQVDQIYRDFTGKVAEGRKLPIEKVLEIARGRVWTGTDAKERGLVDEFGGLRDSLAAARQLAGIADDAKLNVKVYPAPKTPFEAFAAFFGGAHTAVYVLAALEPLIDSDAGKALMGLVREEEEPAMRMTPIMVR